MGGAMTPDARSVPTPCVAPRARPPASATVLVITCGALAREILALIDLNGWSSARVACLPAALHNRPERIPERLRALIRVGKAKYRRIVVAYADCGSGGRIARVAAEEGALFLGGPHCYALYAGAERFATLAAAELGTFYLTDYLARHFDTLVIRGLGLDRHPQLYAPLFGRYRRLLYLAQTDDPALDSAARRAAIRLRLRFERLDVGYGDLAPLLADALAPDTSDAVVDAAAVDA